MSPTIRRTRRTGLPACRQAGGLSHTALLAAVVAAAVATMSQGQVPGTCSCGADPPGPPKNREVRPYANTPEDLRPYGNFTAPYYEHYQKQVEYNGGARDVPTVKPQDVDEVRIGFLGPVGNHPQQAPRRTKLKGG